MRLGLETGTWREPGVEAVRGNQNGQCNGHLTMICHLGKLCVKLPAQGIAFYKAREDAKRAIEVDSNSSSTAHLSQLYVRARKIIE